MSNSFNELIPFVYDEQEDAQSQDGTEDLNYGREEDAITIDLVKPTSSRQKKKKAKLNFSRSWPKGHHYT